MAIFCNLFDTFEVSVSQRCQHTAFTRTLRQTLPETLRPEGQWVAPRGKNDNVVTISFFLRALQESAQISQTWLGLFP